jgi:hypothetical protein
MQVRDVGSFLWLHVSGRLCLPATDGYNCAVPGLAGSCPPVASPCPSLATWWRIQYLCYSVVAAGRPRPERNFLIKVRSVVNFVSWKKGKRSIVDTWVYIMRTRACMGNRQPMILLLDQIDGIYIRREKRRKQPQQKKHRWLMWLYLRHNSCFNFLFDILLHWYYRVGDVFNIKKITLWL